MLTPARPFAAVAWQRGRMSNPGEERWPVMSQLLLTSRSEEREAEEERRKFELAKEKAEGRQKESGVMMTGFEGGEQVRSRRR